LLIATVFDTWHMRWWFALIKYSTSCPSSFFQLERCQDSGILV